MRVKFFSWAIFLVIFFLIFKGWFSLTPISSGDLTYFSKEMMRQHFVPPYAWENFINNGLGGRATFFLGSYLYNLPLGFFSHFFPYSLVQRIIWFWPILILAIFSPQILFKALGLPKKFSLFSSLVYALNSYFLMIVSGGQITVALGYVMIPLVLALFLNAFKTLNLKSIFLFSLALSFLVAFDFRFAYLFFLIILIYFLFLLFSKFTILNFRQVTASYFKVLFPVFLINVGIHAYWLLPLMVTQFTGIGGVDKIHVSPESVTYFSFASFSKAISLFHPNWPENIFGKVNFLNPAFLVLPVIAFSSLLFINELKSSRVKKKILFFASLALMGAFLAKGSNPPFGGVYLWLFKHFPGMIMFRDATKFYTLTALSYSILIPWVLSQFHGKKAKLFPWLFALFWLFLIPQAWLGKIGGTLKPKSVPQDYVFLKDFLVSQNNFFRTLWLPTWQRFAFYSHQHPVMAARDWMADEKCFPPFCDLKMEKYNREYFNCHPNEHCFPADFSFLAHPQAPEVLSQLSVKYLIIPYDSEGEIFKRERKYDQDAWKQLIEFVESLGVYQPVDLPGKVRIYQLPETKDHFWLASDQAEVNYQAINPTKYKVQIQNARQPFKLVFSETYDELWQRKIGERTISSKRAYDQLNSFSIEQFGDFEITVEYAPQKYVYYGLIVSGITALCVLLFLKHC